MSKRAKTVIYLTLRATTVKRLSAPEYVQRFHTVFVDVSSELIPTRRYVNDSRGGKPPFSPDDTKCLDSWDRLRSALGSVILECRGVIRGGIGIAPDAGLQPKGDVSYAPMGNSIGAHFELASLVERGLFDSALRLFRNIIEYVDACHGLASIGAASTATYTDEDNPDYHKPYPVDWNGVLIEPRGVDAPYRSGPAVYCLPTFESWINVLGREYVEMLGRDRLLALDVCKKHEDGAGRIWLQMTERPEQMYLPETKAHIKKLMDSLDAADVFCREPRTQEERQHGVKGYRRPEFAWSGVCVEEKKQDPFSTEKSSVGIVIGKTPISCSVGVNKTLSHNMDLWRLICTMLEQVLPIKGPLEPLGLALAEDDEVLSLKVREPRRWMLQDKADLVAEGLAQMREKRRIKATGVCFRGKGRVPGQPQEATAFKMHLESAAGDAYILYLPFDERGGKREYGTLVMEPGELVVFDEPKTRGDCS